jgi:hypothetical protein
LEPFWKFRFRLEDDFWMSPKGIGHEDMDWTHYDQDTEKWHVLMNTVMKPRFIKNTNLVSC